MRPRAAVAIHRGARSARGRRPRAIGRHVAGWLFLIPAVALFGFFVAFPACQTVYLSFFEWDGIGVARPVGIQNYLEVVTNPLLRNSIVNALILVVFFAFIPIAVGLLIVGLAGRVEIRGLRYFRTIIFLPQVLPMVAIGIMWRWMYEPNGLVNQALRAVGLSGLEHAWLGDPEWALVAVGMIGTWALTGLCMTLFFSGLYKIDPQLYDAVAIDGGGAVRQFFTVTFRGLTREIGVALTLTVIAALASFDIIYVTTNGSPANLTTVPGLLVYRLAFDSSDIGAASALAIVLMAFVLLVILLVNRLTSRADREA